MDDNRTFSVAVADLITRELEQGANPADVAGMLTGMALAVLDDESGIEDAAVAGSTAREAVSGSFASASRSASLEFPRGPFSTLGKQNIKIGGGALAEVVAAHIQELARSRVQGAGRSFSGLSRLAV